MPSVIIREARSQLNQLIDESAHTRQPILITSKRNNALLVSEEDWMAIQASISLLSIPGMGESIREGIVDVIDEYPNRLDG